MKRPKENIDRASWQPVLLNAKTDLNQQAKRAGNKGSLKLIDTYEEQLRELFLLRNPKFRFNQNFELQWQQFLRAHSGTKPLYEKGSWFYFPWIRTVIHYLPENLHLELRTGRNRNLITEEEQHKFYGSCIGFMGMSVGSHAALTIAMTGGAKHIKLADPDTISGSNLNRIRAGFSSIGLPKVIAVARQIYEINPYSRITLYPQGITDSNIEQFFSRPKINLLVEETDSPYLKIKARSLAKKYKIPVIMAADNDDGVIVDVERFDLKPRLPILHGILGNVTAEQFKTLPPQKLPQVIAKIAGANLSTARMLQSVLEVGKTLYSWPQLGTAATLCGSTLANIARKILLGAKIKSGRYDISINNYFLTPSVYEKNIKQKLLNRLKSYGN